MEEPYYVVAPIVDPLEGLEGDERKGAARKLVERVIAFLRSEEGLMAGEPVPHPAFGWVLPVDPAFVAFQTGANFPVTQIRVAYDGGRPLPFYGWSGDNGTSLLLVKFADCTLFDYEDGDFFRSLAGVFGSDGVLFGVDILF